MSSVSPSSKTVDDFLSSLSQLSQDKLRQDQQRQRDLQRNIDDLRLRLASLSPVKRSGAVLDTYGSSTNSVEISLLKFSRKSPNHLSKYLSSSNQDESELAPSLPTRRYLHDDYSENENAPPLPQRTVKKTPPAKPNKLLQNSDNSFEIDLMQPVARKSDSVFPGAYNIKTNNNYTINLVNTSDAMPKKKSFFDLEHDIRAEKEPPRFRTTTKADPPANPVKFVPKTSNEASNVPPKPKKLDFSPGKPSFSTSFSEKGKIPDSAPKLKPDWLNSNRINQAKPLDKSTNINDPVPVTPSRVTVGNQEKPTDWLSSLYNNSSKKSVKPPTAPKPTFLDSPSSQKISQEASLSNGNSEEKKRDFAKPDVGKKPTSWIDSAMKKTDKGPEKSLLVGSTETEKEHEPFNILKNGNKSTERSTILAPIKPPKPSKPSIEHYVKQDQELLQRAKSQLCNKPVVPRSSKPSIEKYKESDTEELKKQLKQLNSSPTKLGSLSNHYKEKDTELLRSQLSRLCSKPVHQKVPVEKSQDEIEALSALAKLKPIKPPKSKSIGVTSDSQQKSAVLKSNTPPQEPETPPLGPETDFKAQLSTILTAGSASLIRSNDIATKTDSVKVNNQANSGSDKLTHPNKSRAKGPKRRLPKNKGTTTAVAANEDTSSSIADYKPRKPPAINRRKPNVPRVKPRLVSGEIFI